MQHPILDPPIKSVCTTTSEASSMNPVFIIETRYDSAKGNWYRKYSDGVIEQGGYGTDQVAESTWEVDFMVEYTTTNIDIHITPVFDAVPSAFNGGMAVDAITTEGFTIHGDNSVSATQGYYWEARGL